jgi:hypothetical protein
MHGEERISPKTVLGLVGLGALFGVITSAAFTAPGTGSPWGGLICLVVFTFVTLMAAFHES